ncbi:MAG: serine--tRNA ligase, partial [Rhodospirillales bacterium]
MFDIRWIRENPEAFDRGLGRRGLEPLSARLVDIDKTRRAAMTRAQEIKAERNTLSKQIGAAKKKGEDASDIMARVAEGKEEEARAEEQAKAASEELEALLGALPNIPADDVPDGEDENDNVEARTWGVKPSFGFEPRDHVDLGETLGMMDFERAAKLSGSRFVVLSGALARLERALAAFMLDLH